MSVFMYLGVTLGQVHLTATELYWIPLGVSTTGLSISQSELRNQME